MQIVSFKYFADVIKILRATDWELFFSFKKMCFYTL